MVKHVILWKLNESLDAQEAINVKQQIKANLEGLVGQIPGLVSMHIQIDKLESSNADLMMDSVFENEEALKGYQKHPFHVHVADTYVRPNVVTRLCLDFEI